MKFYRIWAIVLRYIFAWIHNLNSFLDEIFWPVMDIILWGMTSVWVQENQTQISNVVLVSLTCLVFWQIVQRATDVVSYNLLEELWERNLINLFSTPLTIFEWISAVIILSFLRIICTLVVCFFAVWILYSLNIFSVGWMIIPFMGSLLLSGLFIGFLTVGFIVYWGRKASSFTWIVIWLFAPFSAVYYPLDVLPSWAQSFGHALPMTYTFKGMRQILFDGTFPLSDLLISFGLNALYLVLSMIFFVFMFERSKSKGFARLQ